MRRPSLPGLLIIENPCGEWLLGKLQRNAHYLALAKTRAFRLFQLRGAIASALGSQPVSVPLLPCFGINHYGHQESFTRGEYFPFCAQT